MKARSLRDPPVPSSRTFFLLSCIILVICTPTLLNAERTAQKIYQPIKGAVTCFRRLNGTHQIGCSSSRKGNVGVLYLIKDHDDLNVVVRDGPHDPYIVVLYPESFNVSVMSKLRNSGRVNGLLLLQEPDTTSTRNRDFSQDSSCPNTAFGLYTKPGEKSVCEANPWNKNGTGLMFEDWEFPIFLVRQSSDVDSIVKCFEDFNKPINGSNRDWPLCAAQLTSFMLAAVDTPRCIRRSQVFSIYEGSTKVCDPMGDYNLWATLNPSNQSEPYQDPEGSVIVISARFDAFSMFDQTSPGADTAATGIVTLLSVLKHLAEIKEELKSSDIKNVYFLLPNGEAFDYIGSGRMAFDMLQEKFPFESTNGSQAAALLRLKDIKYFIEISQVALNDNQTTYYIHKNDVPGSQRVIDALKQNAASLQFEDVPTTRGSQLPPASFQSFLRAKSDIPGIVIANHEKEFKNKFYNSVFDDAIQLHFNYNGTITANSVQTKIANLAVSIANSVVSIMHPKRATKFTANATFVNELLNCYVSTAKCSLFQTITSSDKLPTTPYSLYVGVPRHTNPISYLTKTLMSYLQGTNVSKVETDCKNDPEKPNVIYTWINGSCYETSANWSAAVSPVFIGDNYDPTHKNNYSAWAESVWPHDISVRIFLKPSLGQELITLFSGMAVAVISFLIVGWISGKTDVIFHPREDARIC